MGGILFKVHKSSRWVAAICDKEIYGRRLVEDKFNLDLSGDFFNGDVLKEEELLEEIRRCVVEDATFNIVGENSVKVAKKAGLVTPEGIRVIEGVPVALVLL